MKKTSVFRCTNCDYESSKWMGMCPNCKEWNTFEEENIVTTKSGKKTSGEGAKVIYINEVVKEDLERISTGLSEFDRVLGRNPSFDKKKEVNGLVKGSVTLLSGEPGIGKSTLLLQACVQFASSKMKVAYVSAEESVTQIAIRAERTIQNKKDLEKVIFINNYNVDKIISTLEEEKIEIAVIDSIQTIASEESMGNPGGTSQVKHCASKLINFAKSNNVTLFIVGHINKEGSIAGPKILEHLVDCVIQIEGERGGELRIIRTLKNRFGPTNEVGIFRMEEGGLVDVVDPYSLFNSEKPSPGTAKSAIIEGNRVLVVEVQSLVSPTIFPLPKRVSEGFSLSRLQIICAIIQKYLKINLSDKDVYVNIAEVFV